MASGRKTRVDTSQLQFCRLLCRFFFQLLKHTESVASCAAHNMLFYGGLQHGHWFISGAVYMPFFSRVLTEYETANSVYVMVSFLCISDPLGKEIKVNSFSP